MSNELNVDEKRGCGCATIIFIILVLLGVIEPSTLLLVILAIVILALLN